MYEWHLRDRILAIGARPLIMGIVNVTPDSFSDGGRHASTEAAVVHALELVRQGADILDIGGESTRPGAKPVALAEELLCVLPVIEILAKQITNLLSVDTSKAGVARAALEAGAHIINDVTALTGDPSMPEVARSCAAGVILMHMQGTPQTMQLDPRYEEVVTDIGRYFEQRIRTLADQGVLRERIVLDPGIGFGKTGVHNLQILARLNELQYLGRPLCLGVCAKRSSAG